MNWIKVVVDYIEAIAGVPNYEQYVAHMREYHADQSILNEKEFHQKAIDERYGSGTIRRCC